MPHPSVHMRAAIELFDQNPDTIRGQCRILENVIGMRTIHLGATETPSFARKINDIAGIELHPETGRVGFGVSRHVENVLSRQRQLVIAVARQVDHLDAGDPVLRDLGKVEHHVGARGHEGVEAALAVDLGKVRIGNVDGVVIKGALMVLPAEIGAATIDARLTSEGAPYYPVTVRIDVDANASARHLEIIPGMTAQVSIVTGERTILEYVFKPIFKLAETAFRER